MPNFSPHLKVAVIRGGDSQGYDDSLKAGAHILSGLREAEEAFKPLDIFVSKDGEWHRDGLVHEPHHALRGTDVAWNTLHSSYGSFVPVQRVIGSMHIPFIGSRAAASALSVNKDVVGKTYRDSLLTSPGHAFIVGDELDDGELIRIFQSLIHPVRIRSYGTSDFVEPHIAYSFRELKEAVRGVMEHSPKVLVEEFIGGNEVFCTTIQKGRGENSSALEPIVLRGKLNLRRDQRKKIMDMTERAHEALGLSHYSGSHFLVTPKNGIYVLKTDPSPIIHEDSPVYNSLTKAGWKTVDFVKHIINLAV